MNVKVQKELDEHRHLFGGGVEENLRAVGLDPQLWEEWKSASRAWRSDPLPARDVGWTPWSALDAWEEEHPLATAAILAAYRRPLSSVDVAMASYS